MEYYHPSEVHPHASAESMDTVFAQAPVSGLAVACVETVLEHGSLDVVAFVLLLWRKALYLFSEQVGLDVLVLEVSPAGLVVPRYAPPLPRSLVRDGIDCLKGISRGYFPDC